jgi:uncharacterized protein YukE
MSTKGVQGISVNGVKQISDALDKYKASVLAKIDISATEKLLQEAIKGSGSENAFKAAANELNKTVMELVDFVDYFKNQLTTIEANYKKHDSSVTMKFTS